MTNSNQSGGIEWVTFVRRYKPMKQRKVPSDGKSKSAGGVVVDESGGVVSGRRVARRQKQTMMRNGQYVFAFWKLKAK